MWKYINIVFGYLNLNLDLNLNFKVMDFKCLNFKYKYWNISYGFLKIYGFRSYVKFNGGFVKYKSICPNPTSNHTQTYSPCMLDWKKTKHGFNIQWIRLCHVVITLTYLLGKVFFFFWETNTHTHKGEGKGFLTQRHTTTPLKSWSAWFVWNSFLVTTYLAWAQFD